MDVFLLLNAYVFKITRVVQPWEKNPNKDYSYKNITNSNGLFLKEIFIN